MKVTNPINKSLPAMLEQLRADKIRFERKAEFYDLLWRKLQDLEEVYDDTVPYSKWDKFYKLWKVAADRCGKYERIAFDLSTYIENLEYTLQEVDELYEYLNE